MLLNHGEVKQPNVTYPIWLVVTGTMEFSLTFHMGMFENRVYSQWNSHLVGTMIINHWV